MKNFIKITSLLLAAFTLQIDAAQFQAGPAGLQAACALAKTNRGGLFQQGFQKFYGALPSQLCSPAVLSAVSGIQTYIAANFNSGGFTTSAAATAFANTYADYSYLFGNNIFSAHYLDIATKQIEKALAHQTGRGDESVKTLRTIADKLDRFTGAKVGVSPTEKELLRNINVAAGDVETDEEQMRFFLNDLTLSYDSASKQLISSPLALTFSGSPVTPAEVYETPLVQYANTTFARRLALIMPNFAIRSLIENPTSLLTLNRLSKSLVLKDSKFIANFYRDAENQAKAVINAMADQIKDTNTVIDTAVTAVAATGGVVPPPADGRLVTKATNLITYLQKGGSAGIETFVADLVAQKASSLGTAVPSVFNRFTSTVSSVRANLGYAGGTIKDQYEVFADQCEAMAPVLGRYSATEPKVKAMTEYLMSQLYTSFMWLTSNKDIAGTNIKEVPEFGDLKVTAKNIGEAAEKRIKQLNSEIGTLSTENATLRTRGGGAGAESNPDVVSIMSQVASLHGVLAQCNAVHGKAMDSKAQLDVTPAAVSQMTMALADLSSAVPAGLPATDGADLSRKVRIAVIQQDGDLVDAAKAAAGLGAWLGQSVAVFSGTPRAIQTPRFKDAVEEMNAALTRLATNAALKAPLVPAANGADLATAIEDAFKKAGTGTAAELASLKAVNNDVLGGFITLPASIAPGADLAAVINDVKANATMVMQAIQGLAIDAGLQANGRPLPAVGVGALTQVDKLTIPVGSTLQETISTHLLLRFLEHLVNEKSSKYMDAMLAGSLNFAKLHVEHLVGKPGEALIDHIERVSNMFRHSLAFSIELYDKLAMTLPATGSFANFSALQTAMVDKIEKLKTDAATAERESITRQLMDPVSGTLGFAAFPTSAGKPQFALKNLEIKALPADTDLVAVADFYRQCAQAAFVLKTEGGVAGPFATMQDLIKESVDGITKKVAGPGGGAAPAVAVGIPQPVIEAQNAEITKVAKFLRGLRVDSVFASGDASMNAAGPAAFRWMLSANSMSRTLKANGALGITIIQITRNSDNVILGEVELVAESEKINPENSKPFGALPYEVVNGKKAVPYTIAIVAAS